MADLGAIATSSDVTSAAELISGSMYSSPIGDPNQVIRVHNATGLKSDPPTAWMTITSPITPMIITPSANSLVIQG